MGEVTLSEGKFEQFCQSNEIRYRRIQTSRTARKRFPDYDIFAPCGIIVAEIKQFDPNEDERRLYDQLRTRGHTDVYGGEPGAKVRLKIQDGVKQLRARSQGQHPTLLVLYNNIPLTNRAVDPYNIKTGMYGIETIQLAIDRSSGDTREVDRGFGPKRKVSPHDNTSLSAVAVLYEVTGTLWLFVYHNIYSAKPLSPDWLCSPHIRHFTLRAREKGTFQEWQEVE